MPSKSPTNDYICSYLDCKHRFFKLFSDVVADTYHFSVSVSHQLVCEHNAEHVNNAHEQLFADDLYTSNLFYLHSDFNYLSQPEQ